MNDVELIRLFAILLVLTLTAVTSHYAASEDPAHTTIHNLRVGSWATIAIAMFLCVRALVLGAEQVTYFPTLSVSSIVQYVYGLGLLMYVTIYCLLDISSARNFYFISLIGISIDDIMERCRESKTRRILLVFTTLLSLIAFSAKIIISQDVNEIVDAMYTSNYFVLSFGFILPILVPSIYLLVRTRRTYNPSTVMEFIHVSMPFAVHASVSTLLSLSLISYDPASGILTLNASTPTLSWGNATSLTDQLVQDARLVTASDVATPLLVYFTLQALCLLIHATLLYSIADFMASSAIVMAWKHFIETNATDPACTIILVAGTTAFLARVYMCFQDTGDYHSAKYTADADSEELRPVKLHVVSPCQEEAPDV